MGVRPRSPPGEAKTTMIIGVSVAVWRGRREGLMRAVAVLTLVVGLVAGCASTVDGVGSGSGSSVQSAPGPGSLPGSGAGSGSGSASSSGSSAPGGCAGGAAFCDDFSDPKSGWPVEQKPHFYAGYDTYRGGTYHMGERFAASLSEEAPVRVSSFAPDYGVQADVDVFAGPNMDHSTSAGLTCWQHAAGNDNSSAFVFEISGTDAQLFLWNDTDGTVLDIAKKDTTAFQFNGTVNHITISCTRQGSGVTAPAQLSMVVNGQTMFQETYSASVGPWKVGDSVGLVAGGRGSDLFYDNFSLRAAA
jgi:hypothetical protein